MSLNAYVRLFYRIEIGVRAVWIEDFVAVHNGHKVFSLREIDDVVGVAREHYHALDLVAADLEFYHFVSAAAE